MRNNKIPFEDLLKMNKRESNFSKRMDKTPRDIDSSLIEETNVFYNTCVKPTVRKNYMKLIANN